MTEGTSTFNGLGVPLLGESEIAQQTAATDILTITGASSQAGDFLVMQDASGNELFVVTAAPAVNLAINSTTATNYGIKLTLGASAVAAAVIEYDAGITATCTSFLQVNGSKAPSYLLSVGASAAGIGGASDNGLFESATRFISAPDTVLTYGAVKMLAGSKCYYLLAIPDTGMANT